MDLSWERDESPFFVFFWLVVDSFACGLTRIVFKYIPDVTPAALLADIVFSKLARTLPTAELRRDIVEK